MHPLFLFTCPTCFTTGMPALTKVGGENFVPVYARAHVDTVAGSTKTEPSSSRSGTLAGRLKH
jgi:hypothetical protein